MCLTTLIFFKFRSVNLFAQVVTDSSPSQPLLLQVKQALRMPQGEIWKQHHSQEG